MSSAGAADGVVLRPNMSSAGVAAGVSAAGVSAAGVSAAAGASAGVSTGVSSSSLSPSAGTPSWLHTMVRSAFVSSNSEAASAWQAKRKVSSPR